MGLRTREELLLTAKICVEMGFFLFLSRPLAKAKFSEITNCQTKPDHSNSSRIVIACENSRLTSGGFQIPRVSLGGF